MMTIEQLAYTIGTLGILSSEAQNWSVYNVIKLRIET